MQLSKIQCPQCKHYDSCSQKTRMFINYCGSTLSMVEENIRAAVSECRSKRGVILKSVVFAASEKLNLKKIAIPRGAM